MKKIFTLLVITVSIATQKINAQLDMAFISDFSVTSSNTVNRLTWTVAYNQGANQFEIERCTNGKDFKTVAVMMATEKTATESYKYSDAASGPDKIMYRLKISSKTQHVFYSKIVVTQSKVAPTYDIKLMGNPVRDKLSLSYSSKNGRQTDIKIYNMSGKIVVDQKITSATGNNLITIPLHAVSPGMYAIEINDDSSTRKATFIKQ